jgi:DNA-binding beta-propeller fold protein YncE
MKKIAGLLIILLCSLSANAQPAPPLSLLRTILLPGVLGKFDHFAIDLTGNRLFAATTGNHSVEVINLNTDRAEQNIEGLGKPHGLTWVAKTGRLYVADGKLGELRVYQGAPLKLTGTIRLSEDADDMVYDRQNRTLYVGHGGAPAIPAGVAVIDTATFTLTKDIPVATHPEALAVDARGQRVFANIADSSEVAVINAHTNTLSALWRLLGESDNVPLDDDSGQNLLYIACRAPGTVMAINGASGAEISRQRTAADADDLFYDSALHRVYVITGEGEVDTYQVDPQKKLHALAATHTARGAKTGLFVPSQNILYVGIPGIDGNSARIRVYATPAGEHK